MIKRKESKAILKLLVERREETVGKVNQSTEEGGRSYWRLI